MATEGFIEEEHPSDALLHVTAATRRDLFANAARACFALMTDLDAVRPAVSRRVACEGRDIEDLLVVWLNELIGIAAIDGLFFSRFDVTDLAETRLSAQAHGEPIDPARHPLRKEVKAATYHRLWIREAAGGWEASVLFDL
jgi:SHS2 domain-containing protein